MLWVYHEKQDAGLCAVHCLNSLLQGHYFSEIDLMSIAKEFDEKERQVMLESGVDSKAFLEFMAEESGNLADDGNYSLQVLAKALEVWGLRVVPLVVPEARDAKENPLIEQGFICNLASHWLTIRKVGSQWYNLNSLLESPQLLSAFYLSAFLDTLASQGYSVFAVRGSLPSVLPDAAALADGGWKKAPGTEAVAKPIVDQELEDALEASELEAAIAASLTPNTMDAMDQGEEYDDEDEELRAALSLSNQPQTIQVQVEDEPPKDQDATEIVFRLPDGSRIQRRFRRSSSVEAVINFLSSQGISMNSHVLMATLPPRRFENPAQSLEEAGLFPSTTLIVQSK